MKIHMLNLRMLEPSRSNQMRVGSFRDGRNVNPDFRELLLPFNAPNVEHSIREQNHG